MKNIIQGSGKANFVEGKSWRDPNFEYVSPVACFGPAGENGFQRPAYRSPWKPDTACALIGFRVVLGQRLTDFS